MYQWLLVVVLVSLPGLGKAELHDLKRCDLETVEGSDKPVWVCKEPYTAKPTSSPTTRAPTGAPTTGPTRNPTRSPTQNPTKSPTLSNSKMILYAYSPTTVPSAFGSDNNYADDVCRTQAPTVLSATNAARCDYWRALLCYNGTTPSPGTASYNLQDWAYRWRLRGLVSVYGPDGTTSVGTWGTGAGYTLGGGGSTLAASLTTAGVLPTGVRFWTGCTDTGLAELTNNCQGWSSTSSSSSARAGYTSTQGSGWLSSVLRTCDTTQRAVCACLILN